MDDTCRLIEAMTHGKTIPMWGLYSRYIERPPDNNDWYLCFNDDRYPQLFREWENATFALVNRHKNPDVEYVILAVHVNQVTADEHHAVLSNLQHPLSDAMIAEAASDPIVNCG